LEIIDSSNASPALSAETALLGSDPTVGYTLAPGKTTILLSLSEIENISSISFLNKGVSGNLTISTSSARLAADSPQWVQVAQQPIAGEAVKATVGPTEAKYVRVTFDTAQAGEISGFGVYGTPSPSDFTVPRPRQVSNDPAASNGGESLSNVHRQARALFVSSGADMNAANNMIDDSLVTTFDFAPGDPTPTAIIDLGKASSVRKLSAIHSARPGTLHFYVLPNLPQELQTTGGAPARLTDAMWSQFTPVATASVQDKGQTSVEFPAAEGRYIMVRWTPATAEQAFTVAEIAAFGNGTGDRQLLAQNTQDVPAEGPAENAEEVAGEATAGTAVTTNDVSDGKELIDSKIVADGKELLDEAIEDIPAEGPPPPNLPPPPPFTFIPQIVPTSP
jgi:hypothetical protein